MAAAAQATTQDVPRGRLGLPGFVPRGPLSPGQMEVLVPTPAFLRTFHGKSRAEQRGGEKGHVSVPAPRVCAVVFRKLERQLLRGPKMRPSLLDAWILSRTLFLKKPAYLVLDELFLLEKILSGAASPAESESGSRPEPEGKRELAPCTPWSQALAV